MEKTPQLENGYTKIANEIVEALCCFRIPGNEMQCLLFIIRKTYGYSRKYDWISNSQFVDATGLNKGNVSRALRSLIDKKMVIKNDNKTKPSYCINKKYNEWKKLSKTQPVIKNATKVIKNDNNSYQKRRTQKKKETIQNKTTLVLFEFWNSQEIIKHRRLTEQIAGHISSKLNDYSEEEIKKTILNYSNILKSKNHYPTYKWTLPEFFTRNNGFEKYHDDADPFNNFMKFKKDFEIQKNQNNIGQRVVSGVEATKKYLENLTKK